MSKIRIGQCAFLFVFPILLTLNGCQARTGSVEAETSITFNTQDVGKSEQVDNSEVMADQVFQVEFIRDEEAFQQIAEDLILSQYESGINRVSEYEWRVMDNDSLLAAFSCDSSWFLSYIDYINDCNGTHEETAYTLTYGYITDIIPNGLDFTAEEAGQLLCTFLLQYTEVFSFQTYRVLAENQADENLSGYYSVFARALYDGIPLVLDADAGENHVWAYANIGPNGIFSLDGMFLLKETSRQTVEIVEQAAVQTHLSENYAAITRASEVEIDSVELQYFVDTREDGAYSMYPVWAFSGTLAFNEDGYVYTTQASILYYAETGALCDVYYPGL